MRRLIWHQFERADVRRVPYSPGEKYEVSLSVQLHVHPARPHAFRPRLKPSRERSCVLRTAHRRQEEISCRIYRTSPLITGVDARIYPSCEDRTRQPDGSHVLLESKRKWSLKCIGVWVALVVRGDTKRVSIVALCEAEAARSCRKHFAKDGLICGKHADCARYRP